MAVEKVEKDPRKPVPAIVIISPEGEPPSKNPKRKEAITFTRKVPMNLCDLCGFWSIHRSNEPMAARRIKKTRVKILFCENAKKHQSEFMKSFIFLLSLTSWHVYQSDMQEALRELKLREN
jgi:hypothetical protein